jgi:glycosyltransferase involved in cell wall biosynthesis
MAVRESCVYAISFMDEKHMILKLLPSLRARSLADGRVVLTKKFIAGVNEFQKAWAGPVSVYMLAAEHPAGQMDEVSVWPKDLSFDIEVLSLPEASRAITADRSAVVLLSLDDFRQSGLGALCRQSGVACSYISEYSLATRKQIIDATTPNPLKRIRRKFWETNQERKRLAAVASASGLQCNGTPTYEAYRDLCAETILFFDTRVTEDLLATEAEVLQRLSRSTASRRLQLVFSGRLSPMKGCLDLLEVAKELRRMSVEFHLSICGDGESKQALRQTIEVEQLSQHVSLNGILEFEHELMPFVRSDIDLFICCHPQGDPSCTYLETMSCGVPIAGYANEAFEGIVRSSGVGWTVPMNRPDELARMVLDIQRTPEALRENSLGALAFAKGHTFNRTVSRRIGHLRAIGSGSGERRTEPAMKALKHRAASGT